MESSNLEFWQIKALAKHIDANDNPRFAGDDLSANGFSLACRFDTRVQLNRFEFGILVVVPEDLLRALHAFGASHQDMTPIIIGPELVYSRSRDRFVGSLQIEFNHSAKTNGLKVALFLSFPKWVFEDDLPVERLAILSERRGSEL